MTLIGVHIMLIFAQMVNRNVTLKFNWRDWIRPLMDKAMHACIDSEDRYNNNNVYVWIQQVSVSSYIAIAGIYVATS